MKIEIEVPDSLLESIPKEQLQKIFEMVFSMWPMLEKWAFSIEKETPQKIE